MKLAELELELQKMKGNKNKMAKNHREEMRNKDRKEMMIFVVIAACIVMYECVALITKGFL